MKKVLAILALATVASTMLAQTKEITLEDIWQNYVFYPEGISNIRSMNDGEHYTVLTRTGIDKYSYKTGEKEESVCLFSSPDMKKLAKPMPPIESYEFSKDEKKILLSAEFEPLYRHSGVSTYYVYDVAAKSMKRITQEGKQRLTTLSPDGTKVAFVRDNNLYWMDLATLEEHAITSDGKVNEIINGTTDWVYEEEFAITQGFQWSPDSKKIAYMRFDESGVREYTMQMWGDLYPENYKYKYPKAGEDNSKVEMWVYNLDKGKATRLLSTDKTWEYIPRFQWTNDANRLAVMRMNRLQNSMEILVMDDVANGSNHFYGLYGERCDTYVEVPDTWRFITVGKGKNAKEQMLITSEKDGYRHIYLYGIDGKLVKQVTSGQWEVKAVCGVDEKNNTIYYTSKESNSVNTDLYKIGFDGKKKQCLNHSGLGTYSATFSNGCKYYISVYSNANAAPTYSLYNAQGKLVKTLVDNAALQSKMKEYGTGHKQFGTFATSNGTELNYYTIKPADFDENKKYPVLVYVYGGPGNQQVTNSYGYNDYYWYHMLAQKGYVVMCFDGRGTGGRGAEFKKQTYKDLGRMECEDAIEAARWLGKQSWVDSERIGIWGWSFGGYLSSLAILKGNDVFKTAIAVAPVITWRYYDNIYTERFLALPQDNAKGYDENSPLNFADRLQGNYLLIHGTGDDNVHVQNSLDMLSALEKAGKQFEFRLYPNKNHSIYGGNTRLNLYQLMTDYILRKL